MLNLNTKITELNRVGKAMAGRLKKLGIVTAEDLLFYFPFRYEDFTKLTPISELRAGTNANVVGCIELIQNKKSFRKKMNITEALINDETESLKVIWFNQPFIAKSLRAGDKISLAGKVEEDMGGFVMKSPVYEKISTNRGVHTQGLVPDYHLTANLTNKQLRFLIKQVIALANQIPDWLPETIREKLKLISLSEAISQAHFPKNNFEAERAKRRLAFNELFLLQLQFKIIRRDLNERKAEKINFFQDETKSFVDALPFKLTDSQRKAAWEILNDMKKERPMSRLLSGDVGSGKTIVAIIAILNTILNGKQAILMAPTEILAKQHFETFCKLFREFNFNIGLVTASKKKLNNEKNIHDSLFIIHNSQIIIGTHALVQKTIQFENPGLVIIDEQHRFGVEQRATLLASKNGLNPHFLSMTATPIPRSLALAICGDLELSTLKEMPAGRKKIITKVVAEESRQAAYDFIKKEINAGRQAFVICPLIDESDKLGVKSVKKEFEKLDKIIFPNLKIEMLHGRMRSAEKERIMQSFLENKTKILVSTSVIEVGIDVPNATIMIIEGADRFGLAQLHQFRGRVGRSEFQSYCFLLSENSSPKTENRLKALVDCADGFSLAKLDLKFRGAGEIYGTAQKGFPELKMADLFDYELMKQASEQADMLISISPDLSEYPQLKGEIELKKAQSHLE